MRKMREEKKAQNPMSSTLRRRVFLTIYLAAMAAASIFLLVRAFSSGEMVQIDDQEAVMRRRTSSVLTALSIDDPCWPEVTISDHLLLFSLSQQINSVPRVKGQFPGEAPGKLSGRMTFASGEEEPFSISTVLTIGQTVYYSPEAQAALEEIRSTLASQLYTLESLGSFFHPDRQVTLSDGENTLLLPPESMEPLRGVIEGGALVEDFEEIDQLVGGPPSRYTIHVRSPEGLDQLRLTVYANESIQVYDTYSSGQPLLFCFSGELVPLCQGLMG